MQRSGTEAIRNQIQPSKPKREITKVTNSQNTKRIYGQQNAKTERKMLMAMDRDSQAGDNYMCIYMTGTTEALYQPARNWKATTVPIIALNV